MRPGSTPWASAASSTVGVGCSVSMTGMSTPRAAKKSMTD